jgi:hypothetical protein
MRVWVAFLKMSRVAVLVHRQRSFEGLQQLLAWYKIRDTLFGANYVDQDQESARPCFCL